MTPAARGGKRGRGGKSRGRRRSAAPKIAFALLVALAAGMAGLAMYFGFIPGPWAERGTAPVDSGLVIDTLPRPADAAAPAPDTAVHGAPVAGASAPTAPAGVRAITVADSAAGDALYHGAGRCVGCHGALAEGAATLGPSLRDSAWTTGDGSAAGIARVIANGAPGTGAFRIAMPAYSSQLGMPDIDRIAAYVYTLSHPGAVVSDTLPTPGEAGNVDARPTVPAPGITPSPAPTPSGTTARPMRPTVPAPSFPPAPRRP